MRLKFVLLMSLIGAVVAAASSTIIITLTMGWSGLAVDRLEFRINDWVTLMVIPPVVMSVLASVFVYRHTARRRKLQGGLTGIMIILFSLIIILVALSLVPRRRLNVVDPLPNAGLNRFLSAPASTHR